MSRRDLARWALLGSGSAPFLAWVAACSSDAAESGAAPTSTMTPLATPTTPTTAAPTTTLRPSTTHATSTTAAPTATATPATTAPFDPTRPWWLQGNFAPVGQETEATPLVVRGAIPPELEGLYVRNGSNPPRSDSPHWFFGDGMLHGVKLGGGKAEWYRNKYVQTSMYTSGAGFGQGAPGGASNQSNVSAFWHGGRLLTSGEVGYPYELDPTDLSTKGVFDFGGALTTSFTAHPKIDPATGRMHAFGYGFTPPFLTYHVIEPDGTLAHSEVVELPRSTMIHDFAITESDVVFWDLPVVFDLEAAIAFIENPAAGAFPYQWSPEAGARVGVMPLGGPASAIEWFEIDPCYAFHGVNAFRRGDAVVLDICRLSAMFEEGTTLGSELTLHRWTMNDGVGHVMDEQIAGPDSGELPTRDPRRVGREHRYGYFVGTRPSVETVDFGGLIKHNYATGRRDVWEPAPNVHAGEWLFVPAGDDADDAGYLLTFLHDESSGLSELAIVDATDVSAGPIAHVELPVRVPYGFHATWVPTT